MSTEGRGGRWTLPEATATLVVLAAYAYCLYDLPTQTFWSPDEGGKLLQTATIQWDGGLKYVLPYLGERVDPELRFYADRPEPGDSTFIYPVRRADGQFNFHWPMTFAYIVKVPVVLFGPTGGYLVALLAGLTTVILSGRVARRIDARLGAVALLVTGLATPIWFYSLCFWEHTLVAAAGMAAVLFLIRAERSVRALLGPLLLFGLALTLRLEAAVPLVAGVAAFVIVMLRRSFAAATEAQATRPFRRRAADLLVVAVLVVVTLAAVSLVLPDRHHFLISDFPRRLTRFDRLWGAITVLVADSQSSNGPHLGPGRLYLGMAGMVLCCLAGVVRRSTAQGLLAVVGLGLLTAVSIEIALEGENDRSMHGLLTTAPFVALAPLAFRRAWREAGSALFPLGVFAVLYFLAGVVVMGALHGDRLGNLALGLEWGQRYLLLLYPVLAILSLVAVQEYWRSPAHRGLKVLITSLMVVALGTSVAHEVRGYGESQRTREALSLWQAQLQQVAMVVTDIWWLPAALSDLYTRKEIYVVYSSNEVREWARLANPPANATVAFAGFRDVRLRDFGEPPPRLVRRRKRSVAGLQLLVFSVADDPRGSRRGILQPPHPPTR